MRKYDRKELYTLICSFLPGAVEMYLGFMKNGLTLMGVFFLGIVLPVALEASKVFFLLPVLIWFYGFFHARNLIDMEPAARHQKADLCIWDEFRGAELASLSSAEIRRIAGIFLVVCGVILLWNQLAVILTAMIPSALLEKLLPVVHTIPRLVIAILVLLAGARLMRPETTLPAEVEEPETKEEEFSDRAEDPEALVEEESSDSEAPSVPEESQEEVVVDTALVQEAAANESESEDEPEIEDESSDRS